jgi:hypothetical protein
VAMTAGPMEQTVSGIICKSFSSGALFVNQIGPRPRQQRQSAQRASLRHTFRPQLSDRPHAAAGTQCSAEWYVAQSGTWRSMRHACTSEARHGIRKRNGRGVVWHVQRLGGAAPGSSGVARHGAPSTATGGLAAASCGCGASRGPTRPAGLGVGWRSTARHVMASCREGSENRKARRTRRKRVPRAFVGGSRADAPVQ